MGGGLFLTDDEVTRLVRALAEARRDRWFTEEEAEKVLDWGNRVRINQALLSLVLSGEVLVDVNEEGDLVFARVGQSKRKEG